MKRQKAGKDEKMGTEKERLKEMTTKARQRMGARENAQAAKNVREIEQDQKRANKLAVRDVKGKEIRERRKQRGRMLS